MSFMQQAPGRKRNQEVVINVKAVSGRGGEGRGSEIAREPTEEEGGGKAEMKGNVLQAVGDRTAHKVSSHVTQTSCFRLSSVR